MATARTILFAGAGSGGHIFPNIAVLERLQEGRIPVTPHFLVSTRPLDKQIVQKQGFPLTVIPAAPLGTRPDRLIRFLSGFKRSEALAHQLIARTRPAAMVSTGGFVAAPAASAALKHGIAVALVNLDAVPGRANKAFARKASVVFSVYPSVALPRAEAIGLPLRRAAVTTVSPQAARERLGLDPHVDTLLVTAGSQGASSINQMMAELCTRTHARHALERSKWQVLHLTGFADHTEVQRAYTRAGIQARVEPFCNAMGLAWTAATIGISRAGAGSIAEAWANAVPTVFLPYPYHKDEHQRFNAEPLVSAGSALLLRDRIDPIENVNQLTGPLLALMANENQRQKMRVALRSTCPPDGAETIAHWVTMAMGVGSTAGRKHREATAG